MWEIILTITKTPAMFQTVGMAILTIIIPLAIGVVIEALRKRDMLTTRTFLNEILNIKRNFIFVVLFVFITPLVFQFQKPILSFIGIILWLIGLRVLIKILSLNIDWIVGGNRWKYIMNYLKKKKDYDTFVEDWSEVWKSDNNMPFDEVKNLFFERIKNLLNKIREEVNNIRIIKVDYRLPQLFDIFISYLNKKGWMFSVSEDFLSLHFEFWKIIPKDKKAFLPYTSQKIELVISELMKKYLQLMIVSIDSFLGDKPEKYTEMFVNEILYKILLKESYRIENINIPHNWVINDNNIRNKELGFYIFYAFLNDWVSNILKLKDEDIKDIRHFITLFFRDFDWLLLTPWLVFAFTPYVGNRCEYVIKHGRWELCILLAEKPIAFWRGEKRIEEIEKIYEKKSRDTVIFIKKYLGQPTKENLEQWLEELEKIDDKNLNSKEQTNKQALKELFELLLNED